MNLGNDRNKQNPVPSKTDGKKHLRKLRAAAVDVLEMGFCHTSFLQMGKLMVLHQF